MRVLIINKFLYPNGGSETYIFKLGEVLEQHGHEVQYFGMEHKGRCVGNRVNAYYVQQAIFVVCGKILGFDYLVYAWMMLIFGLIAPIFLSKYVVRKNHMLSTLILGR